MKLWRPLAAVLLALTLTACGDKPDEAFGRKVRAYLLEHPEVLQEAYVRLQAKQQEQAMAEASKAIGEHRQALEHDPRDMVVNPDGKVTVVEFLDFNCSYCKLIAPEVLALIKANPDVRFVFKDLTIFGETSEYAAAGVRMARPAQTYLGLHRALMEEKPLEDDDVARILAAHGVSPADARKRQQSDEQKTYLADTQQLAVALGIRGTPAFVVGNTLIPAADPAALKAAIDQAKSAKS